MAQCLNNIACNGLRQCNIENHFETDLNMILATKGISKSFGSLRALSDVSFGVKEGQIFGIAGPNGAGKTTLFNVIAGHYPVSAGSILFDGQDITRLRADQICQRGLARTFQVPATFKTLSVYDNILVGATFGNKGKAPKSEIVNKVIELLDLKRFAYVEASHLDLYTTKLVMIGACLATGCRLLMLDEPLAGLGINEIEDFLGGVKNVNRERKVTIVMIEHILDSLLEVSEQVLILNNGEVLYNGDPQGVFKDQKVVECYLGEGEVC